MSVISEVYRLCKRLGIKLLEFVYNNTYVLLLFLFFFIVSIFCVENILIYNVSNIIYNVIWFLYIFGWIYDGHKKNKRIKELEEQLNKEVLVSKNLIREELADVMHQIWANDMQYTNIFSSISSSERDRVYTLYNDLPEFDKVVNRNKADKVINILEHYRVL